MVERERRGRWPIVALVFAGCWLVRAHGAADPEPGALHLVVQPERPWVVAGNPLDVTVGLRNAHNQPAPAPTEFAIALAVVPPIAGVGATVTIPAGQSAAALQLKPASVGILEIRATHPQALDGGTFVRVVKHAPPSRRAPSAKPSSAAAPPAGSRPSRTSPSKSIAPQPSRLVLPAVTARRRAADLERDSTPAPSPAPPAAPEEKAPLPAGAPDPTAVLDPPVVAPQQPATAPPQPADPPQSTDASDAGKSSTPRLTLHYSPQRTLLADGQDAATIQAFLQSDDAEPVELADGSFKVNLFASSGTLTPRPLVVQGLEGRSTLTSDHAGDVDVEFVSSQPFAQIEGDRRLRVHFGPPIHSLHLAAKPAEISLVDDTDLVVTLLDAAGRAVITDEPRVVLLALDAGRGEIEQKELTIKPGSFEVRTRFVATGVGAVDVSAASTMLQTQRARVDVRLPLGMLGISVIGGLVGGLLAFLRRRGRSWTRVAIGGVTGFLLYWAFIFGLMRLMPRAFVLNPLSNFALSTLGGWLGTEVFAILLQRLGLGPSRGRKEHGSAKHRAHGDPAHEAQGGDEPEAKSPEPQRAAHADGAMEAADAEVRARRVHGASAELEDG